MDSKHTLKVVTRSFLLGCNRQTTTRTSYSICKYIGKWGDRTRGARQEVSK